MSDCDAAIRWPGQREPFVCRSDGQHSLHRDGDGSLWQITWTDAHPHAFRRDPAFPPRQRFGHRLRELRGAAGLTMEQVAEHLECSVSKVIRVEQGRTRVLPRDVRDLLDLYGVDDAEREALIQAARDLRSAK